MPSEWRHILFDIETNGLLDTVSVLHCICIMDVKTGELRSFSSLSPAYGHEPLSVALEILANAERLYGHNIVTYDAPALAKLVGLRLPVAKLRDTLILARLIWPEIKQGDMLRFKRGQMPGNLIGKHSLEAWGVRLGEKKGSFGKQKVEGGSVWDTCTPEMVDYCGQDLRTNFELYKRIAGKIKEGWLTPAAIDLEHEVADLCFRMTESGFVFDVKAGGELYATLAAELNDVSARLQHAFPPIERCTTIIPKVNNSKIGYVKGKPFVKRKLEKLNPGSRDQIAERLKLRYGWDAPRDPVTGRVKLDDDVLAKLNFPEIADIRAYLDISKTLGLVAQGKNGWLKLEKNGRIHARYETAGAVTGRATHATPNIAQVPSVSHGPNGVLLGREGGYGWECRSLFTVPPGWFLVGADMSGLELRCLGHFVAVYDAGDYIKVVLDGDVHTVNQKAAGLPTRADAKTFIYAYLYGAGDAKIGSIVLPNGTEKEQKAAGAKIKAEFLKSMPALKKLRQAIKAAAEQGWIEGLDGRRLTIRKAHAALNTLLQSAGALLCKRWLILIEHELTARGLVWGRDFAFCAWVHDEVQIAARTKEIADVVAEVCCAMATKAGEVMGFACRLNGDAKIGRTWAETH